jgi:hypothetical protein
MYIENQIMKPCLQMLAIALEQVPGYVRSAALSGDRAMQELVVAKKGNAAKARERLDTLREREVAKLVFDPVLAHPTFRERDARIDRTTKAMANAANKQNEITRYFSQNR